MAETEFLTTRELAAMLRVKERKVYELASDGALPVRRLTGKLLFPRAEIEEWIVTNDDAVSPQVRPAVMAGGHDPLLEWALRDSRSGIAAFLDGALDGLERAAKGDCIAAGLHIPEPGNAWNVAAVGQAFGDKPVVLIEWARDPRPSRSPEHHQELLVAVAAWHRTLPGSSLSSSYELAD